MTLRLGAAVLTLAAGLLSSACTTVTVHAGDGTVTVQRSFGLLTVQPTPRQTAMVVHSATLGWQSGPTGQGIGYVQSRLTLLPPGCHLVLVDADVARLAESPVNPLIGPGLCRADRFATGER